MIKRRLATLDECKFDLKKELKLLFKAFNYATKKFESEIIQTPVDARARAFEASLFNSKMIQAIQKYFPKNCKFLKYKRFVLQKNGYNIFFKKLNTKNKPMNIKTKTVNAIANQYVLFSEDNYASEPILFFGYRKDRLNNIIDPKLVYIDEDKVKWIIDEQQLGNDVKETQAINEDIVEDYPTPKLKIRKSKTGT